MEKIKGSRGGEMVYASGTRNEIFGCVCDEKMGRNALHSMIFQSGIRQRHASKL